MDEMNGNRLLKIEDVFDTIAPIFNKPCCRKQVSFLKKISLGFGARLPHGLPDHFKLRDNYYGEWELGSWNLSSWRIVKDGKIICGSNDSSEVKELDLQVGKIEFGNLINLQQTNDFDIRAVFDKGIFLDFLSTVKVSGEDDSFHVSGPDKLFVAFYSGRGWIIKRTP